MPGAIFLDARSNAQFYNWNSFIYGHNDRYGSMFAQLEKFRDTRFYQTHPSIYLYTPNQNYICEVFAMYETTAISKTYSMHINNEEDFLSYIAMIENTHGNHTSIDFSTPSSIITLSTCSYEHDDPNARYVLHAKLNKR